MVFKIIDLTLLLYGGVNGADNDELVMTVFTSFVLLAC